MPRVARNALLAAGMLLAAAVGLWFATFHIAAVGRADATMFAGFSSLAAHPHVQGLASRIASLCDPGRYVWLCLVPVVVALVRRRWRHALVILVVLVGANLTAELLKPLLAAPRAGAGAGAGAGWLPGPGSWPSGHATAAMVLALCLVIASPARLRPWVAAAGGLFAVAVSYSFLTLGWHYPTDALAGFLVAGIWSLLGIAVLARRRCVVVATPWRRDAAGALTPAALAIGAGLACFALVLVLSPAALGFVALHKTLTVGVLGLGVASLLLPALVTLSVVGPGDGRRVQR